MTGGGVYRALDRLRFGPRRTLNVREAGLTGSEAAHRVETWLRTRQLEFAGDVLVITGRGAGSRDGIAVVREATLKTLRTLRRSGVVAAIHEDTPGSFVVSIAPLRSLLEAPVRRTARPDLAAGGRGRAPGTSSRQNQAAATKGQIVGIGEESHRLLNDLARLSLASLGIGSPSDAQVGDEMARQFSLLVRAIPVGGAGDRVLQEALRRGILEYEDHY